MKMNLGLITALTLVAFPALADQTNAIVPAKIGTADADKHYDQEMIVTGTVAQVTVRPTIIFINLDKPHPDSPFTAVIQSSYTNQFGDVHLLKGRAVEIKGKVRNFHDKPEIALESTNQLKVLEMPASTNVPPAI